MCNRLLNNFNFLSVPTIEEPVQAGTHPNASKTALDKFMKFDRKYATIKEPKRSDLIVEETDESEPIINYEKSTPSPRDSHHGQSRLRRQAEQVINANICISEWNSEWLKNSTPIDQLNR